jgi:PKD repeat protein
MGQACPLSSICQTNMVGDDQPVVMAIRWKCCGREINNPVLIVSTPGPHTVKLVVKTNVGCESDTVTKTFIVNPAPVVNITAQNGCLNVPINFFGMQTDNITTITQWNWNFGDGTTSTLQDLYTIFQLQGI